MKLKSYILVGYVISTLLTIIVVFWAIQRMLIEEREIYFLVGMTLMASFVGDGISLFLLSPVFTSLGKLKEHAKQVADKDFLSNLEVQGPVEFQQLGQAFNEMSHDLQATEILKEFGLFDVADKYPHELSGGMRQRVALLRTYMFGHKLFLLDEAFSALDELTKMELHVWYLDIHRRLGLTTLLITHSIEEALALSDRIYILKNRPGQIVADLQLTWSDSEDKEVQKLAYKRQILELLGVE